MHRGKLAKRLPHADPLPLDFMQQQFQAGQVWVAVDRHEAIVGYAIALEVDGTLYLQQIDVATEHGRRRIGSALVDGVEGALEQKTTLRPKRFTCMAFKR